LEEKMNRKQYIVAWKRVIQACKDGEDILIALEWSRAMTPEEARRKFLEALHRRINKRGGLVTSGKRDYEAKAWRDQAKIRFARMGGIVREFETKEVRERFSHLIFSED
jgi:hypothetical protein